MKSLLPANAFARNVGVLAGGAAAAQLLSVLAAPLLTRLYKPDDFGLVAVYAGVLALAGVVSSLRYELAIPLSESDAEAACVTTLSLLFVGLSTLLAALALAIFGTSIAAALSMPALIGLLWLLPVGVLLGGVYRVFNYWAVRERAFRAIAGTRLSQSAVTIAFQLCAFRLGGCALVYGQVLGQGVGSARLARRALANDGFRQVRWRGMADVARRYRRFPVFTTWAGLINTAGQQLPPLAFAAIFGVAASGFYALAHRMLTLPAALLGSAIANVFLAQGATAKRDGSLAVLYRDLQDKLVQLGLPPMAVVVFAGPSLFSAVFGAEWRVAGELAQWLALSAFAGFLVSPLSQLFIIIEKQSVGLALQSLLFLSRLGGIALGAWAGSLELAVALFAMGGVLGYAVYLLVMPVYAGAPLTALLRSLVTALFFALVICLPLLVSLAAAGPVAMAVGLLLSMLALALRYRFVMDDAE